jgi:hypothetical protein
MRKFLFTSALALLALATVSARAMPFLPIAKAPSDIALVAMGCGPGWIRGPYGGCHPMGYNYTYAYGYHPYYNRPYYRHYNRPYYRHYNRPYYRHYNRPHYRHYYRPYHHPYYHLYR